MRCLITAGPTYEPLDRVRRLTNFSTGRLGSYLAEWLARHGAEVVLLRGEMSSWPHVPANCAVEMFSTGEDLARRLQARRPWKPHAIFHAAAVCDYRPGRIRLRGPRGGLRDLRPEGKIPTRLGTLTVELVPTSKILACLRDWFPEAALVGWKYETDGGPEEALARGAAQLRETRSDGCAVNGPAWGEGYALLWKGREEAPITCPDLPALCAALAEGAAKILADRGSAPE